ncbi:TRAP transporter permease [Lachnospiraceae bacterium 62-35]
MKEKIISGIALIFGIFHLYTSFMGNLDPYRLREGHLLFAMVLILLMKPASKKYPDSIVGKVWTGIMLICTIIPLGYLILDYTKLLQRMPYVQELKAFQYVFVVMLTIALLEGTRRSLGAALPIVASLAILYGMAGQYLPGLFGHQGFTRLEMADLLVYTTEGIFGMALGTSATFVILFIIFGAFLEKAGVAGYFMDLSCALTAKSRGGPAKMSVISSALFGSVSGSSIANVATTGQITIPLMKKAGYKPEFAAAVEAVASTGGQLMPPVMGAAVFVMCDFTGIPYVEILKCAILPALLFYSAVFFMVHFEAVRWKLSGVSSENMPKKQTLVKGAYQLFPLAAIVVMLVLGYSPTYACLLAIISIIVVSWINPEKRMGILAIGQALSEGAKGAVGVAVTCATAGIVVGIVNYSGLALKFTSLMLAIGKENLLLVLILTAMATIILGMGLPTTPSYIVVASLMVPTIVKLDIPLIAAHLFAFYFANVANITPPVALASYTAAGLAESEPLKTGFLGFRLGIVAYIVPFMFAYNTGLLLIGNNISQLVLTAATSFVGVYFLAGASEGWLLEKTKPAERILLGAAALTLIYPGIYTDIAGILMGGAVVVLQKARIKKRDGRLQEQ